MWTPDSAVQKFKLEEISPISKTIHRKRWGDRYTFCGIDLSRGWWRFYEIVEKRQEKMVNCPKCLKALNNMEVK